MAEPSYGTYGRRRTLLFDGATTSKATPKNFGDILGPDESFSLSLWMLPHTITALDNLIVATTGGGWSDGVGIHALNTTYQWRMWVGDYNAASGRQVDTNALSVGDPHYVGLSWNGTTNTISAIVDGVVHNTTSGAALSMDGTNNALVLGEYRAASPSTYCFDGLIDEFLFFDRALTEAEWRKQHRRQRRTYVFVPMAGASGTTVEAAAGSIQFTAHAATVSRDITVSASAGAIAFTPQPAAVNAATAVSASAGAIAFAPQAAAVNAARAVSANAGAIAFTGQAATIGAGTVISAAAGDIRIAGANASVNAERSVSANAGAINYSGHPASVSLGFAVAAAAGAVAFQGQTAAVKADRSVSADAGSIAYTGHAATVSTGTNVAAAAGQIAFTALSAAIKADRNIAAAFGQVQWTAHAGTVATGGAIVSVAAGAITWTPHAATVFAGVTPEPGRTITAQAGERTIEIEKGKRAISAAAGERTIETARFS